MIISLVIVLVMISVLLPTTSVSASNGPWTRVVIGVGSIIEEVEGDDAAIVTFKGQAVRHWQGSSLGYEGNWKVNFQNVNNNDLDGAEFTSTSITFLTINNPVKHIVTVVAAGRLTGEEDEYHIEVRMQDNGEPGKGTDSIRIILYQWSINNPTYDTYDNEWWDPPQYGYKGDFPDEDAPLYDEEDWEISVRTKLDSGNIKFE